jgi:hypothetical protein
VLSVDELLGGIGLSGAERPDWYRDRVTLSRADGSEYRQRQQVLRRLLGRPDALSAELGDDLTRVLEDRRRALAPPAARLGALARDGNPRAADGAPLP